MRIHLKESVLDAALNRIRWLFDEFDQVVVSFSGGKDSTVVLNLTLQVAEEKGRLPVPVLFIDQEAEWQAVVDYTREVMADPRVDPMWMQVPLRIFNGTSHQDQWLNCWEPGETWMRDREPGAFTENIYGTRTFYDLFGAIVRHHFGSASCVNMAGVRAEESPARLAGLTSAETYKGETWGKIRDRRIGHYDMYPIYDWSYTDVWKAIHDHGWSYCRAYDAQYSLGLSIQKMRISNLHHETSLSTLYYLQEAEPETWEKLTSRLSGINTAGQMKSDAFAVTDLPAAFTSWQEYRDFLIERLPETPEIRGVFRREANRIDSKFEGLPQQYRDQMDRGIINAVLADDYHLAKIRNLEMSGIFAAWRRHFQGKPYPEHFRAKMFPEGETSDVVL
jgi:predicted phosphoadenosine phosphosulfate sulfurtransferase